jgi:hypothetical protein
MTLDSEYTTGYKALDKLLDCYEKGAGPVSHTLFKLLKTRAAAHHSRARAATFKETIETLTGEVEADRDRVGHVEFKGEGWRWVSTEETPHIQPAGAPVEYRGLSRLAYQETRKQYNLEKIMLHAADDLLKGEFPEGNGVDENWCFRFFDLAATACSDRMQVIWGQVLAREIRQPRSYSFRTLEVLKNATADLIDALVKASRLRLDHGSVSLILYPENFNRLERELGLPVTSILTLQEVGVIVHDPNVRFTLPAIQAPDTVHLRHDRKVIVLYRKGEAPGISLPAIVFTKVGRELASLVGGRENVAYARSVANQLRDGCTRICYGDIHLAVGSELLIENEIEV